MSEIFKEKDGRIPFQLSHLRNELIGMIQRIGNLSKYEYERDFQDELVKILGQKYTAVPEVKTMPCFDENSDRKYWRIDIVIKLGNQYVPIELKYRHGEQSIEGYDSDYVEDVDRIRNLLIKYDDIPLGYAICVTDNVELVSTCKEKQKEYNADKNLKGIHQMSIEWKHLTQRGYQLGIAGWHWGEPKSPTNKYFKEYWDKKVNK